MALILSALDSDTTARQHTVMALAFLGLRRGEIAGVKWEDVNLAAGSLWVRRSAWQGIVADSPKNSQSVREVTLGTVATKALARLRRLNLNPDTAFVIQNEVGGAVDLGLYSSRVLRPTFERLGLTWRGLHAGRRGAETEMQGHTNGNTQITSHHFGHSKEVADAHYTKPLPDATRQAALAFDSALSTALKNLMEDSGGQQIQ